MKWFRLLMLRKCSVSGRRFKKGQGVLSDTWKPRVDLVDRLEFLEEEVKRMERRNMKLIERLMEKGLLGDDE